MFGLSRAIRRRTALGLLALMSGLWLLAAAAPCVMAAPHCPDRGVPCEAANQAVLAAAADCEILQAADCQRADISLADRLAVPDFSALPPRLLTVASIAVQPAGRASPADPRRFALRLSPPPLYLRHAALLI